MRSYTVKVSQRGLVPYSFDVIAKNSISALLIGLSTMAFPGCIVVRPT